MATDIRERMMATICTRNSTRNRSLDCGWFFYLNVSLKSNALWNTRLVTQRITPNKHGYGYDQIISVKLSDEELKAFNAYISELRNNEETDNYVKLFVHMIFVGKNYTTLTTRNLFKKFFGIEDKRWLDRNTLIKVA